MSRMVQAQALAEHTGFPVVDEKNSNYDLQLCFTSERIELFDTTLNTSVYVDFVEGALAHRQQYGGGRGQAIAKAIGLKKGNTPSVLDITVTGVVSYYFGKKSVEEKKILVEKKKHSDNSTENKR